MTIISDWENSLPKALFMTKVMNVFKPYDFQGLEEAGPPLVVHIVYRLATGGLENGVINLINNMSANYCRHAIICLTESTDFCDRIQRRDVVTIALNKHNGHDFGHYVRMWRILRKLRPDIIHTRNLPGLEYLMLAALAGVPGRIHGEHGRDVYDIDGLNLKYNLLRKAIKPLVHRYIAVSKELANWLVNIVGVRPERVTQIYNGVDQNRFFPRNGSKPTIGPAGFASPGSFIVGTVGRLEVVKDQLTLVNAFLRLLETDPGIRNRLRLVIVGDGSLRAEVLRLLRERRAENLSWIPGERDDIHQILHGFDLFVLPSLKEGISNTILEAMASGLPVVATRVGGNPELVIEGETGMLVPSSDPVAMADAIRTYFNDPDMLIRHGQAGHKRVEQHFSMEKMVNGYMAVYDSVLNKNKR